ncbi:carbamoyl-phosphate synthase small subunit [Rhodothalassium salexigens DSM 2132]|uniref:Carbamoyl phosphate synthase small chain n=1 Tax=Rhodothalassium salexigens DSM 2132 TaxID=1188247 RepID=A0A4V2SPA5_RHOSA|nr:glutamine-hydrolyzing carbamoyl-phosphate synthase small subunit [Rhodothalassium salexigens]MBB4211786.1 carbamoyl-phosphate synthase small subunit [Rhodothalassium salexigens DSM 2132]MBK1638121.1 carbamoyl phosphate synthase small subunit [Rhodothalassium salexigens DSM 2132]TCP33916.1 carbamoyl-phosphate synthase small subunit [Rhodothalassium salexigens DSM 2132]
MPHADTPEPRSRLAKPFDPTPLATAVLVLADGTVFRGQGCGAEGVAVGEVCFNTAMTGYQEILTDPSYAGQIITFTFPHIGNVGVNPEDMEAERPAARGFVLREPVTGPSNWRAAQDFDAWARGHGLVGLSGVDTRALTRAVRRGAAPTGVIAHNPDGAFDLADLQAQAAAWPGLAGMDLAQAVSTPGEPRPWGQGAWSVAKGYAAAPESGPHIVVVDYGTKHNILRNLARAGARVTVVPADTTAEAIAALKPDGVVLSNGPGDPAATAHYAVPTIRALIHTGMPLYGICLGHQLLSLALGGKTVKMAQGHRGANHPVKDLATGRVDITSMNHGFAVDPDSLPADVKVTQVSLFDGSVCAIEAEGRKILSVQQHPEASPGPQDSFALFDRFLAMVKS